MKHIDMTDSPQSNTGDKIKYIDDTTLVESRPLPSSDARAESLGSGYPNDFRDVKGKRFMVLPLMETERAQWGIYCRWCGNVFVGTDRKNELHGSLGASAQVRHIEERQSTSLA